MFPSIPQGAAMDKKTIVIVGLGNPGREYSNTRHNIGFLAIERISEELSIRISSKKLNGTIGEGLYRGDKVILVKPGTFMNLSGICVRDVMSYFKIAIEDLFVISDDFNLPFGAFRIRRGGSSGGHKGLSSIIQEMGGTGFARLRAGIGPLPEGRESIGFVLEEFNKNEQKDLPELLIRITDAAKIYIENGIEEAMSAFNTRIRNTEPSSAGNENLPEKGKAEIMENSLRGTMAQQEKNLQPQSYGDRDKIVDGAGDV
jgi:peptidyl-tRNA hydrolase, PTH1 family